MDDDLFSTNASARLAIARRKGHEACGADLNPWTRPPLCLGRGTEAPACSLC